MAALQCSLEQQSDPLLLIRSRNRHRSPRERGGDLRLLGLHDSAQNQMTADPDRVDQQLGAPDEERTREVGRDDINVPGPSDGVGVEENAAMGDRDAADGNTSARSARLKTTLSTAGLSRRFSSADRIASASVSIPSAACAPSCRAAIASTPDPVPTSSTDAAVRSSLWSRPRHRRVVA